MLSALAALVRRHDPDRFLTALFAPEDRRETLFALYAFNHELARAREVASEPTLALIRLQWWREVVEGTIRRHEVAGPLRQALSDGRLAAPELLEMIDAREMEADPAIDTNAAWLAYLRGGAGALAVAAGRALGAAEETLVALREVGAAYGVAGLLRSQPMLARQGRCLLPVETLAAAGLSIEDANAAPDGSALGLVRAALAQQGQQMLQRGAARRFSRAEVAAALPGVLARRDLRRGAAPGEGRGIGDRIAVLGAALRGRV